MSKELEKLADIRALINEIYEDETDKSILKSRECFRKYCDDIEKALKEHEQLEGILKNILDRDSDLCVEGWKHYDGHYSYHIVVGEGEHLDIKISKEDYDLLKRYQYGEEENRD